MTQTLVNRINSYQANLSAADQTLAAYIIKNAASAAQFTIQDLATHAQVSTATISRFVKKIGFDSYQDFKLAINTANVTKSTNFFSELSSSDSYRDILLKNFNSNISSLQSTENLISSKDLEETIAILLRSKTCGFFGLGGSSAVALIAYHKFIRMPVNAIYHADFHIQQMLAAKLTKHDCAFVISHTGKNKDTLKVLDILKERKVPVIGITSYAGSPLAKRSDIALITIAEEISFRPEAVASTVSQISLLDSIFMIYGMKKKRQSENSLDSIREVIKDTRI